jgi:hypothetical protein
VEPPAGILKMSVLPKTFLLKTMLAPLGENTGLSAGQPPLSMRVSGDPSTPVT